MPLATTPSRLGSNLQQDATTALWPNRLAQPGADLAPPGFDPGYEVQTMRQIIENSDNHRPSEAVYQRMSLSEYLELPTSNLICEWVAGWAVLMPPEYSDNGFAAFELGFLLKTMFPDLNPIIQSGLDVSDESKRIPDLAVYPRRVPNQVFVADQPIIVAEVLSEATRKQDLVVKRAEYAARGIDQYWILDPKQRRLTVLVNVAGEYLAAASLDDEHPVAEVEVSPYGKVLLDLNVIMPA